MFATHAAAVAFLSALKHRLEGGSSWPDAIGHAGAAEGRTVNEVRIYAAAALQLGLSTQQILAPFIGPDLAEAVEERIRLHADALKALDEVVTGPTGAE